MCRMVILLPPKDRNRCDDYGGDGHRCEPAPRERPAGWRIVSDLIGHRHYLHPLG